MGIVTGAVSVGTLLIAMRCDRRLRTITRRRAKRTSAHARETPMAIPRLDDDDEDDLDDAIDDEVSVL